MARLITLAAAVAASALLGACATEQGVPGPMIAYGRTDCAVAPNLAGALSLTPPKERASFPVVTLVDAAAPCLNSNGKAGPYVVYALPADYDDKTITVGGSLEAIRIFAPSIAVLDASGTVTRTFKPEEYYYRGPLYSVQFRPRPGEAYILVTSDADLVGKRYDSVAIGTATTTYSTGYGAASYTTGVDTSQSRTFSYEGTVQVTVYDSDIKEAARQAG